jgi:hypothetical protein
VPTCRCRGSGRGGRWLGKIIGDGSGRQHGAATLTRMRVILICMTKYRIAMQLRQRSPMALTAWAPTHRQQAEVRGASRQR